MPKPEEVAKYCPELLIEKIGGRNYAWRMLPDDRKNEDDLRQEVPWPVAESLAQARKERNLLKQELERARVLIEWLLEKDINLTDYGYREAKVVFRKSTEALASINKDSSPKA